MNISIARELKSIRVKKNLRREDVAKDLMISLETLRRYEKDARNITVQFLSRILKYYNIDEFIFFKNICELTHENETVV